MGLFRSRESRRQARVRFACDLGRQSRKKLDTDFTDSHGLFMAELLHRDDTHRLIGLCMEIHRELGKGHDEVIYKDALVVELNRANVLFARERKFEVNYKGVVL